MVISTIRRWFSLAAMAALSLVLALPLAAFIPTAEHAHAATTSTGQWTIIQGANKGSLAAVYAISDTNVWAVGDDGSHPLVEHCDGTSCSRVSTPADTLPGYLHAIATISANDIWVVGATITNGVSSGLIIHFDGTSWTIIQAAPIDGFDGVAAVSSNDVWAVGLSVSGADNSLQHWDGTSWSPTPNPNYQVSTFDSVIAFASNDVWALGGATYHWDGQAWNSINPNPDGVTSIGGTSSNNLWGVGTFLDTGTGASNIYNLVNGAWSVFETDSGVLYSSVSMESQTLGMAVGTNGQQPYAKLWNGSSWGDTRPQGVNNGSSPTFLGVSLAGNTTAWAVGRYNTGLGYYNSLVEHFVSSPPTPTVTVQKVWTAYGNNNTQTSFAPGDTIHYRTQVKNTNSTPLTATFRFLVTGPQQIFSWSGSKSVVTGTPTITLASNVPTNPSAGTYTLTVTVTYNGASSQGQSQFIVTSKPSIIAENTDNWAGFRSHNTSLNPVQYTRVYGSWKVPSEPCPSTTQPNRLDIWDGLGGDLSSPLEQVGIALFCNNTPNAGFQVQAWYELLGDSTQPPPYWLSSKPPILAGDVIVATTMYLGTKSSTNTCSSDPKLGSPGGNGVYQFSISDKRTGWKFVSAHLCASDAPTARNSADWIVESHGNLLNFGQANFSVCGTSRGSISDGPIIHQDSMYPLLGNLQAYPLSLSSDSTAFTVKWNHN